jgi:hypothetical protein
MIESKIAVRKMLRRPRDLRSPQYNVRSVSVVLFLKFDGLIFQRPKRVSEVAAELKRIFLSSAFIAIAASTAIVLLIADAIPH